jgi:integrase/recombinase XerD
VARRFLAVVAAAGDAGAEGLTAADVTGFVRRECGRRSVASAKATVTGLRALLRFLCLDGRITAPLAGAVPSAACWQLAALPRAVSPAELAGIMDSCDRGTVAGRRDLAIVLLLARLGLRAGEVAALEPGDINWREGEIAVCGKGGRRDSLPLPADAGEAVAGWLAGGAPAPCRRPGGVRTAAPSAWPARLDQRVVRGAPCLRAGRDRCGRGAPAAAFRRGRHAGGGRDAD